MKQQITILESEFKDGDYPRYRFKMQFSDATIQWASVFNKKPEEVQLCNDLRTHERMLISVEIETKPNKQDSSKPYYNITQFYGKVAPGNEERDPVETFEAPINRPIQTYETSISQDNKNTTMYVSYAKDIFIEFLKHEVTYPDEKRTTDLMKQACDMVQLARVVFK